jgi:hypothetical protein
VLGRDADPEGRLFFEQQLRSGLGREDVVRALLRSPEAYQRVVDRYFADFLRRPGDPEGVRYWVSRLLDGASLAEVGQAFLASDEFFARALERAG